MSGKTDISNRRKQMPENTADKLGRYKRIIALQRVAMVCLIMMIAALIGLSMYLGSLPKSVPWVIELTPDGEATYYPDAVKLLEDWTPNDATQRYFMASYIEHLRGVSTDNYVNRDNAIDVFNKTLGQAAAKIDDWFVVNNPIERSDSEYVLIPPEELSIVRYSDNQWNVTWRETTYRRSDRTIISDTMQTGIFNVEFYTPDTERKRRDNPIGMYIVDYDIDLLRNLM